MGIGRIFNPSAQCNRLGDGATVSGLSRLRSPHSARKGEQLPTTTLKSIAIEKAAMTDICSQTQ